MELVLQVINEGDYAFPDGIKIVQFFCDIEAIQWGNDDGYWLVKTYDKIDMDAAEVINKPAEHNEVHYCEIALKKSKSIPDMEDMQEIPSIAQFLEGLGKSKSNLDWWDVYYATQSALTNESDFSSHIGGYASWIQNSEHPENKDYSLLLQICSEDNANIMWGDCGNIYIFYNPKTKDTKFVFQCS